MKMHVCKIVFNRVKNVRTAYTSGFKDVTCSFLKAEKLHNFLTLNNNNKKEEQLKKHDLS